MISSRQEVRPTDTAQDPTYFGTSVIDGTAYNFFTTTGGNISTTPWIQGVWMPAISGGQDAGDGDGTEDDTSDETEDETSEDQDEGKKFSQKDVNAIVAREVSKKTRGKLDPKELGFDSVKDMKEFLEKVKADQEANKTEDERKRQEELDAAKDEAKAEYLSKAQQIALNAEFKLACIEHDVRRDAIQDAFLLAKAGGLLDDVEVDDDGKVTGLDDSVFEDLKEKKPFLFAEEEEEETGGDVGIRSGGGSGKGGKESAMLRNYPALRTRGVGTIIK